MVKGSWFKVSSLRSLILLGLGIASELALLSLCATVEVGVVLAVRGEVVVGEVGEEGLELEEEAFAGEVAVGVHVEFS